MANVRIADVCDSNEDLKWVLLIRLTNSTLYISLYLRFPLLSMTVE